MKLLPTEILINKDIFFISGTDFVGRITLSMLHQPIIGLCNVTD